MVSKMAKMLQKKRDVSIGYGEHSYSVISIFGKHGKHVMLSIMQILVPNYGELITNMRNL
jgi:hypothetical protein